MTDIVQNFHASFNYVEPDILAVELPRMSINITIYKKVYAVLNKVNCKRLLDCGRAMKDHARIKCRIRSFSSSALCDEIPVCAGIKASGSVLKQSDLKDHLIFMVEKRRCSGNVGIIKRN